jgi:anthranilate phosphoribosyltransferase
VYSLDIVPLVAEAAAQTGAERLFVVHGHDGLDEITTTNLTTVSEVKDGKVETYVLDPETVGVPRANHDDLRGGTPAENAQIILDILNGRTGPKREIVVLNAAAAIVAGGVADTLQDGVLKAEVSIDSGKALGKLNKLKELTRDA